MKLRISVAALLVLMLGCMGFGQANRGTAEITVKGKQISIDYGRPSLKGRDLLGMAPVGMVWRLGMNGATQMTTAANLDVNGKELAAGKYSLWLKKTDANSWALEVHPKTGIWGVPELKEGYVAELPMKLEKAPESDEQLTISLTNKGDKVWVHIQWGTALLTGAFQAKG